MGTAIYMVFNGFFIGYTATQYPLGNYILFNIPYGIPELIAIIISGAAGFRLASCVYHIFNGLTHMRFRYFPNQPVQIYNRDEHG